MKNILKKLFEVKKEVGKISKNSENPFYKSKYIDINKLLEHIEPILTTHGLICLQPIKNNKVYSIIFDIDTTEQIESFIDIPEIKDPQKLGSAITYFRRYTLQSLLSLQAEDDDANSTSNNPTKNNNQTKTNNGDGDKEWVNVYTSKGSGIITDRFKKCWESIHSGEYTIKDIRKKYKVGTETAEKLQDINFLKWN